jgi:hypothetical protein
VKLKKIMRKAVTAAAYHRSYMREAKRVAGGTIANTTTPPENNKG